MKLIKGLEIEEDFYYTKKDIVEKIFLDPENFQIKERFDSIFRKKFGINDEDFSFTNLLVKLYEKIEIETKIFLMKASNTQFIYYPFFLKNNVVLIVAPPGRGKTLWILSMLYRIQNKIPLILFKEYPLYEILPFEFKIDEPVKVCYFTFEEDYTSILEKKERIKKWIEYEKSLLKSDLEKEKKEKETFIDFPVYALSGDIVHSSNRRLLRRFISLHNANFIVIDSVTTAFLSFSSVDKAHQIYDFIARTFLSKGIGVALIMHPSKEDVKQEINLPRGSIHHLAVPRIVWGINFIEEKEFGFTIEIKSEKDNFGLSKFLYRYDFEFDDEEEIYKIMLVNISDAKVKSKKLKDKILSLLEEKEELTVSELSKELNADYDTIRQTLLRLTKEQKVIRTGRGRYMLNKEKETKTDFITKPKGEDEDDNIPF